MPTLSTPNTPYYGGGQVVNPANVVRTSGQPSSVLTPDHLGTLAVDNAARKIYVLVSKTGNVNTWEEILTGSSADFPITPYTVGPLGQATYQDLQEALDAANTAGGGLVYLQKGDYSGNFTFYGGVNIDGAGSNLVRIIGQHVPPLDGVTQFSNVNFTIETTGSIFTDGNFAEQTLIFRSCSETIPDGYLISAPFWQALIIFIDCSEDSSAQNGIVDTLNSAIRIHQSTLGAGTGNSVVIGANSSFSNSSINPPVDIGENASLISSGNTYFNTSTTSVNAIASFDADIFDTGSFESVIQNSSQAISITGCIIKSTAAPYVITGAGSGQVKLTDLSFTQSSSIDPTLNLAYGTNLTGNLETNGAVYFNTTTITNAISPYSSTSTDYELDCDPTAGAITINLPASPLAGRTIIIIDSTNQAATHNITVSGNGNNISSGGSSAASKTISTNGGSLRLSYNGTFWNAF